MEKKYYVENVLKDIEEHHNWSWIKEIYERNKKNMEATAIFYRGNKIKYSEFFQKSIDYAKSLKTLGVKKGDEIPICIANCPEYLYILGGISMIGAKANVFGSGFDKEYIKQIINQSNSSILFASDDMYGDIKDIIDETNIEKKIIISLTDSLPEHKNPYEEFDKPFCSFENYAKNFKNEDESILLESEFSDLGKNYDGEIFDDSIKLDDEFTITYSSGTTSSTRPKGIVHVNRSYVTMARFHDPDIPGTTSMKNMRVLASIPTLSNTNLGFNITDTLMQGSTVALDPIYNKDSLFNSLIINKINVAVTSKSFILHMMKNLPKSAKLPYLVGLFAAGEGTSKGEEKFINSKLKQLKAGTKKFPFPISPIPLSIAGGDCEHGGFYLNVLKKYSDMLPKYALRKEESGVKPLDMVDFEILNKEGEYCNAYEMGRLVANSPCTMKEYKDNPIATSSFFIKDKYGKKWGDCNVYAYYDCYKRLHIKGRYLDVPNITPPFIISDSILKDTKHIMSCEVIPFEENGNVLYVAHVEFQPDNKESNQKLIVGIEKRIKSELGEELSSKVLYRVRSHNEEYPLTPCGKRNSLDLIDEGITDLCIKPILKLNNVFIPLRKSLPIYWSIA